MAIVCNIDQSEHATLEDLHKHLRKLKVKQEVYYTQYAPRLDLATGEPIPFKAPAPEYLKREFKDRITLKRYLKEQPEKGRDWALNWLQNRVTEKGLTRAPSQVELRSIPSPCPDIRYYESTFDGGYGAVCDWLGLAGHRGGPMPTPTPLPGPVVIDTREQQPLALSVPSARGTLKSADYGLSPEYDQQVYIERKSLSDFCGTLSARETRTGDSNLARFSRELERVEEIGAYVVMLVESPLATALSFNHLPQFKLRGPKKFNPETKRIERVYSGVTPEHIFHNLRDLLQRFGANFQALFVEHRLEAANAVVRILAAGEAVKECDLQYLYDTEQLSLEGEVA